MRQFSTLLLLIGVVSWNAAVAPTAANAQAFLVLRLNFDDAVMSVQLERRRLVRYRVLAAQLLLDGGECIAYSSELDGHVRSPSGCFGDAFEVLLSASARVAHAGADGVHGDFGLLSCLDGISASSGARVVISVGQ